MGEAVLISIVMPNCRCHLTSEVTAHRRSKIIKNVSWRRIMCGQLPNARGHGHDPRAGARTRSIVCGHTKTHRRPAMPRTHHTKKHLHWHGMHVAHETISSHTRVQLVNPRGHSASCSSTALRTQSTVGHI